MLVDFAFELNLVFRLLLSSVLGMLIGFERKGGPRGAGPRTFSFICMGSCLFTMLSMYGFLVSGENARVAAQIVSGVGFIGAGVIWRQKGDILHGITTAAAIWVSAACGMAVGVGYNLLALVCALVTMFILSRGHPLKGARQHLGGLS